MSTVSFPYVVNFIVIVGLVAVCYPCPQDSASCCQCVTTPGCGWSVLNGSQPRCVSLVPTSRDSGSDATFVHDLQVPSRLNRPLNPYRRRLIRPQGGRLKMSLGMRKEIPLQILAQSRRMRLTITGPADSLDFSLKRGRALSCIHRFRLRDRILPTGVRKITVDCHVSAMREVQRLNLVVDMNKCFASTKPVSVRVRGSRRFRLEVSSACSCPCLSQELADSQSSQAVCEKGAERQQCVTDEISLCSSMNNNCQRDQNETTCSGQGTCFCGTCMCHALPANQDLVPGNDRDAASIRTGDSEMAPMSNTFYSGSHCECNDFACPRYNQVLCGGPARGVCQCGKCVCVEGFQGDACEMRTGIDACIAPGDGSLCSDSGYCIGGVCMCNSGYAGQFCQHCPTCEGRCSQLAPCVQCVAFSGMESNENQTDCASVCTTNGRGIAVAPSGESFPDSANLCVMNRDGCFYEFAYTSSEGDGISVIYQTPLHCNREVIE